ncbi:amino acid adenylation domain-containing protein [Archangium violaceum]|uniref:non-ribosomal peptide synthetase n=1 Tax=Archangium violaceum TaxID=83451 RepID=UPI001950691F|nr:non-ribosomal peptide synthetase [Archangium violaceum]QRO01823.1 amino acid adenylation domain-containing protein [Archangium violaceum]
MALEKDEVFVFPASSSQRRLWFLDRLEPGLATYNMPFALRLEGSLDIKALGASLDALVERHEVLRTSFEEEEGGEVVQLVHPARPLDVRRVSLASRPREERERELRALCTTEAGAPFSLAQPGLIRATLIELGPSEHVLLLVLHHIISDGWSIGVLTRELAALYPALAAGRESPLEEPELQYVDFSEWQNEWLAGDAPRAQADYWRGKLGGELRQVELPTDRPRPAQATYRGSTREFALSREVSEQVRRFSQEQGATSFMTLLAALDALLHRYTGETDIIVGTAIAGRNRRELEGVIGFFANTLALRVSLEGDPDFRELVRRVKTVTLEAFANQELPFERLVEELRLPRDLGRNPLFQVMLVLENMPLGELELPGLTLRPLEIETHAAKFDLTLSLRDTPEGLQGTVEYNRDLFEPATIDRLVTHFERLLEGTAKPWARVSELPLLGRAEETLLLETWNPPGELPRDGSLLHSRVEAQARRTPDAPAVADETRELTYAELERRANRLARHLRELGVGPEVRVGVCLRRTVDLPVALLAVLKAGGTYAPLDPDYPPERLGYLLEDSCSALVISERSVLPALPVSRPRTLVLEELGDVLSAGPDAPLPASCDAENLAYLIYTSGSTGRPKGVAITHRSAAIFISWALKEFPLDEMRGVLAATSVCFDLSIFELFVPLSCGGRVLVVPNALHLPAFSRRDEVTLVNTVPSAMAELVRARGLPRSVRVVNLAGEALPKRTVDALYALGHVERVLNLYGPSEDTTYSTFDHVPANEGRGPTIGRPLENSQAYVLDRHLRLVPQGVPGELYLAGDGLARGYLLRPDLTAERFLPDPFSRTPGGRMYKTGDLVRYLPDGRLDYLGRLDHQVKVRGFRIELGEIEARLRAHEDVADTVVVAREDTPGDKRLVGYVVPKAGRTISTTSLKSELSKHLPEYMVPPHWVVLEKLPLTPNRKVDRAALPAPERASAGGEGERIAPRTETESKLCELWSELLETQVDDVRQGFFELGGHSLLAMRMVSRVESLFQVRLPLRVIFEVPSLEALAARLDAERKSGSQPALSPVVPQPRTQPLPLSFAQQRLYFLDRLEPGSPFYTIASGVRLTGPLDREALRHALAALVERHESLRTVFTLEQGEPGQRILPPAFELESTDATLLPAHAQEPWAMALADDFARRPFDLSHEIPFRALLVKVGAEEHLLVLAVHHISSDGWSMKLMLRDAAAFYEARRSGRTASLPALPFQYADFAVWQRRLLEGDALVPQLAYWESKLAGPLPLLDLPSDHPRPMQRSDRGETLHFELPPSLSSALLARARAWDVTLFTLLLSGFKAVLSRYARQSDIVVGTPIAGRGTAGTDELVGCFINTLVLRTDLSDTPRFDELLARVKATCIEAFSHPDVPFERLVEHLDPPRSTAHTPLFQAMFVLNEQPSGKGLFADLGVTEVPLEAGTSTFDLTFTVLQEDERLGVAIEYSTDLFEAPSMERLFDSFQALLSDALARPEARVGELGLLSPSARTRLLDGRQPAWVSLPEDETVVSRFEAQAARTPERVALVATDRTLTYGELLAESRALSARLRARGVGRGHRVGVCLERTSLLPVALLGVLGTGASYVPLDPRFPRERLDLMAEDAKLKLTLTERGCVERVGLAAGERLLLDEPAEMGESVAGPGPSGLDEAYVLYTSGSTGRPKGVSVHHGALANFLRSMAEAPGLTAEDVLVAITTLSFDIAALELYLPLLVGARVVLATREEAQDAWRLAERLEQTGATVMQATPTTWRMLLDSGWTNPRRLMQLCGGEPLPSDLAWRLVATGGVLWNLYGPTETTVWSTVEPILPGGGRPTVGRPILNTSIHVLDRNLEPVPVGVTGEVYIGGEGVARGYVGRPELTAERFVPDPFSDRPGARLYGTGDVGRLRDDGRLELLGREDSQVKIRGHRIEVGEVEAALRSEAVVRDAAVVARESSAGGLRLVGYVVARPGESLDPEALRRALEARLPGYMVPSAFVVLSALPMTLNNKVDRKALPPPPEEAVPVGRAPRTEREALVASIFAKAFGRSAVGLDENFFALGGDSIVAMQIVARLRREGLATSPRELFEHPTVGQLAERLVAVEKAAAEAALPLTDAAPLSSMQQGMLFRSLFSPSSRDYFEQVGAMLEAGLDVDAFRAAWQAVLERHVVLRTVLSLEDPSNPVQRVLASPVLPWAVHDGSALSPAAFEASLHGFLEEDLRKGFAFERELLFRVTLWRAPSGEWRFILSFHHAILDGWSLGVLLSEVAALYEGSRKGRAPELLAPPDFWRFVRHERTQDTTPLELFWKETLRGFTSPTALPNSEHVTPGQAEPAYARESTRFEARGSADLQAFCARHGVTLGTLLQAAWGLVLARHAGEGEAVFGSLVSGRSAPVEGVTEMVGLLINTLPTRVTLQPRRPVLEWLRELQRAQADVRERELSPLERVQRWSEVAPGRLLFESVLVVDPWPVRGTERSLFTSVEELGLPRTGFPLHLAAYPGEQLELRLTYDAARFAAPTVARLLGHVRTVLEAVVARPEAPVGRLSLLTPGERDTVLQTWNGTGHAWERPCLLHELFEAQVARTPEAVALVFEGREMTYAALNARANQLAHRLRREGVGPESLVGVFMERSLEMVLALYGALKAGGAYLPLDPSYPVERLAFMVEDAQPRVTLTTRALADRVPAGSGLTLVLDEDGWTEGLPANAASTPPVVGTSLESPAYCIYTSGSTGRPKGALIPHRGIHNRILWMQSAYGMGPEDRVLQKTPFSFDVSVWEFFWPLAVGARLVVARPGGHQDPAYLVRTMEEAGITTAHFVPSMLQFFLAERGLERLGSLSRVFCSGEALPASLQRRFFERLPGSGLYNLYGPTEASVDVSHWTCRADDTRNTVPIGAPVFNTQLYVLDPELNLLPTGALGELYLGGIQLGRCYLRRPDLTADRFMPDPYGGTPGARMYRTGDLARWLEDGTVEYVGRVDSQVKLRGFRIELGEIEAQILAQPDVAEAAVVVRQAPGGDAQLAAYVAPEGGKAEGNWVATLRASLARVLPEYMVPSRFVVLERLPLTSSGKVDRRALPPLPDLETGTAGQEVVTPRNARERALVEIFESVLGIGGVGATSDFFQLGGHSMLALRLIARVESTFGVQLPLSTLFQTSTVEGLAVAVAASGGEQSVLVPLGGQGDAPPLFFIHPVGGNVLSYRALVEGLTKGRRVYALQSHALTGGAADATVEEMAARYLREIRRVQPSGPYHLFGWSMGGVIAFEMARQLQEAGEPPGTLCLLDSTLEGFEKPLTDEDEAALLGAFAVDLGLPAQDVPRGFSLPEVLHAARARGLLPAEAPLATLERLYTVFRTNLAALHRYRPAQAYAGALHLLAAAEGGIRHATTEDWGWAAWVRGGVRVIRTPGDHYSLLTEPNVHVVREHVRALVDGRIDGSQQTRNERT